MAETPLQLHPNHPIRGRPFAKGQSGNPAGRRRGSKNRRTLAARELLDGEAGALTRKAVDMAMSGDATTSGSVSNASWRRAASRRCGSTCRRSAMPAIYRVRWRRS